MASLGDHVRDSAPPEVLSPACDCPMCRDTLLSRKLAREALAGRRAQAGVLVVTLALSTVAVPAPALAQRSGAAARTAQMLDGDRDTIQGDERSQPDTPAAEDDAALGGGNLIVPEPVDGDEEPETTPLSVLAPEQPGETVEPLVVETEPHATESHPEPTSPALPTPAAPPPVPSSPPVVALEDRATAEPSRQGRRLELELQRRSGKTQEPSATSVRRKSTPATAPIAAGADETISVDDRQTPVPRESAQPAPLKGDTYRVRGGDSLWSIALRLLGADAKEAEIAAEVDRLWQLNRKRIATGDPDLLPVGTELRL